MQEECYWYSNMQKQVKQAKYMMPLDTCRVVKSCGDFQLYMTERTSRFYNNLMVNKTINIMTDTAHNKIISFDVDK